MDPRLRTAGALLIGAAAVHVAACFLVLYTIVSIVRLEILLQYHFLDWTAILGIPVQTLGIILQSVFAIIAIAGAVVVLGGYDGGSPVFGTLGLVAILFSFFLFGGMMGVIGGLLFTGAAVLLRPSAETTMPLSTPA